MRSLHFVNSPCYPMGIRNLRSFGRGGGDIFDGGTYIIFAPVSYRTSTLWSRCLKRGNNEEGQKVSVSHLLEATFIQNVHE